MQRMGDEFGIENLGFLTLTFSDQVARMKEAQRRFNSLNANIISKRYRRGIGVWERMQNGRLHLHLVVVVGKDIRTGFDFGAVARRDYRSANAVLRAEWAFWRKTAPAYRFGRTELLPIKSTAEGIAKYVGKYIEKHIYKRRDEDKGHRLVRFLGFTPGDRRFSCGFGWNSRGAWLWRHKVAAFAATLGATSMEDISKLVGPRWAFICKRTILAMEVGTPPSFQNPEG